MNQLYQRAWRGIISPSKFTHQISNFCPKRQMIEGRVLERIDFSFKNNQSKTISAMILKQADSNPENTILYLHGNGGSKLQCIGFAPLICKNNLAVIGFDFVGCGNSDHGFLTYGVNQSKDSQQVIEQAKKYIEIKKLTLWGRSMGAATAIMIAEQKKINVQALILDSPFHSLLDVIQRVMKQETEMPKGLCFVASYFLSQQINKKLRLELFGIDYLEIYRKIGKLMPTLFFYSQSDNIVPKEEVFTFYNSCKSHRQLVEIFEQHEEERSFSVFDEGVQWLKSIPSKKINKIKLCYMNDAIEIESSEIKTGKGFCCCTNIR